MCNFFILLLLWFAHPPSSPHTCRYVAIPGIASTCSVQDSSSNPSYTTRTVYLISTGQPGGRAAAATVLVLGIACQRTTGGEEEEEGSDPLWQYNTNCTYAPHSFVPCILISFLRTGHCNKGFIRYFINKWLLTYYAPSRVWEDWLPKLTLASCSTVSNSRKHLFTTSFEHNFLLISLWELKGVVLNSLRLLDNIPTKSQCDDVEIGCVETRVKRVPWPTPIKNVLFRCSWGICWIQINKNGINTFVVGWSVIRTVSSVGPTNSTFPFPHPVS